jgi:hypothetical protein
LEPIWQNHIGITVSRRNIGYNKPNKNERSNGTVIFKEIFIVAFTMADFFGRFYWANIRYKV